MKVVVASAIISVATIVSAAMISGNLDFKKQAVINTDSGHVNLGEVYSESAFVDIELRFSSDNTKVFELKDVPYQNYMSRIDERFKQLLDDVNKGKPDDKKLTLENLSFIVPSQLTLKAHTTYRSENIPVYELIIDQKVVSFEKGIMARKSVSEAVGQFIKDETSTFQSTFFIKESK